ncbi:MAG: O-antigen ligase family protein [Candidatus Dormibacteraeota bacterium]|nr:O-antigen ligase family protein [Candidatus Dormibacteraeota bacterium]
MPEISLSGGEFRTRFELASTWLPAFVAGLLPILFLPVAVDSFILPRAGLALVGGAGVFGAGLVWGKGRLGALGLPAAATAAAVVLAGLFSLAPNLSLVGAYGRYESAPVRLAYLGLLCGAAWIGERRWVVTAFLVGCGLASTEAIGQALLGALPRPDGNLGQPNLLGGLLAMALPLAVHRGITEAEGGTSGRMGNRPWLVLAGLLAAGLVVSASRSGWLAALAGLAVLAALLAPRRLRWLAAVVGGVLLVAAALLLLLSPLRQLNQDTGSARLGVWRDSLSVVAARPLVGWGEDTLGLVFGRYQTQDWEPGDSFDRAHSLPLDLAAAQGFLGLAACTWLFVTWWWGVLRRPELLGFAGAAAAYLAWAMLNFDWAPVTAAFWLLAGAAWPGRGNGVHRAIVWRGALAAAALVAALSLALPALLADIHFYGGRPAQAAVADPLQPRYRAAAGGLDNLRAAARLNDPQPDVYTSLGDAEAAAGHQQAAGNAYRRALQLYPFYSEARRKLALAAASR